MLNSNNWAYFDYDFALKNHFFDISNPVKDSSINFLNTDGWFFIELIIWYLSLSRAPSRFLAISNCLSAIFYCFEIINIEPFKSGNSFCDSYDGV